MMAANHARTLAGLALGACLTPVYGQETAFLEPNQVLRPTTNEILPGPPGSEPETLRFGESSAVRGNMAMIGMPAFDGSHERDDFIGRVAVFTRDESDTWVRTGSLNPSDPTHFNDFGGRVALGRQIALVGAKTGIYVFRRERGIWHQIQKIGNPPDAQLDGDLAVGDHTAFIGAIGTTGNDQPGAVRAYRIDHRGRLYFLQKLTASDDHPGNRFGERLAFEGDTLVVGARGDDEARGAAYVFKSRGTRWFERQKLIAMNGTPGESFGAALAIAHARIAIGAPFANQLPAPECPGSLSGAVYVFTPHGRTWSIEQEISSPEPCYAQFGIELDMSRRWLVATGQSSFPDTFANPAVFERIAGSFQPVAHLLGSEVSAPTLTINGSTVFAGFPDDKIRNEFSTGVTDVYDLARSRR